MWQRDPVTNVILPKTLGWHCWVSILKVELQLKSVPLSNMILLFVAHFSRSKDEGPLSPRYSTSYSWNGVLTDRLRGSTWRSGVGWPWSFTLLVDGGALFDMWLLTCAYMLRYNIEPVHFQSLRARRTDCYVLAARQETLSFGSVPQLLRPDSFKISWPFSTGRHRIWLSSASSAFSNGETNLQIIRPNEISKAFGNCSLDCQLIKCL
jgi:hypothetical protein